MSEKMYTREQISRALNKITIDGSAKAIVMCALNNSEPTFEEKYIKAVRGYTGSVESAGFIAETIKSYVSSEIDKLRREIGEGK